jgi:diguanylate cyclase (GGDEF)-like protein
MWVSFLDARGISRVGKVGGAWRAVENLVRPEPLFRDLIASLDFDHANVLWMATGGGMKRWDGTNLEIFGRGDGLVSQDPSANGISVSADNGLWQGFSNGISHFSPRAFSGTPAPPGARILEVRDASRAHAPGEAGTAVPYRDRTLTFRFSALSFLNEAKILHEVRLVGLENEWRETQLAEARYPALPDGKYRFEVRSRFEEGPPGPVAGFSFRVLPPWWGTWWFRLLSLLAAGGALFGGYRIRTKRLSARNAFLERMVAHRTEALEASKVELERANRALEEASLVDPLTGLHNRRFLDLSLPTDAAQAQRILREARDTGRDPLELKEDILLFILDIDHFKTVNDSFGHLAGDQVLCQLADILRADTRATDSPVRWGGEEFLLVARRSRRAKAASIAQNLLEAVRAHTFELPEGVRIRKTWSIGFAALPFHPGAPELGDWHQALKIADQCLYAAKNTGRDRYVGALVPAGADPAPFQGLRSWDVPWALERGLVEVRCSEPDFRWPEAL